MNADTDIFGTLEASVATPAATEPPRRRRWPIGLGALVLLGAGALGVRAWLTAGSAPTWRTAEVHRTDVIQTVSVTGTLEAVDSVDVGTQVSGRIVELLADHNDEVQEGQLLARIDPALLEAEVESARATLAQRQAEALLAGRELERARTLAEHDAVTAQELQTAEAAAAVADAQVTSAKVALSRAERNLGYAEIVSPIDGTIVDRLVEVGQTVNAGVSTPTLYSLAGDLDEMQILATVDEADIGLVAAGQTVTFTVQAWPGRTVGGTGRQVRLQATTTDGVVTYTAVVDVDNHGRQLLPGMTAAVDLVVASSEDALTVPAAALRFTPPDATAPKGKGAGGDTVWTVDGAGALQARTVEVGLSDGSTTEVSGEGLTEGVVVVTGQQAGGASSTQRSNPLQAEQSQSGPGPRGF